MDLDIIITNPDGSNALATISDYNLDLYINKPNTLKIDIAKVHTVANNASVKLVYKNKIVFQGFLDYPLPDARNEKIELNCLGQEGMLDYRIGQTYTYLAGTQIGDILDDSAPVPGTVLGFLYLCNSLIPCALFQEYLGASSALVYKVQGYGTTKYPSVSAVTEDGVALTHAGSIPAMTQGSWFQDSTYLYLWCASGEPSENLIMMDTLKITGDYIPSGTATGRWVIYGAGIYSAFGAITDLYKGTTKLTKLDSIAVLYQDSFYQDEDNLIIKIGIAEDINSVIMSIPNWKDTHLRLGNCSISTWTFSTDYVLENKQMSKNLDDLFTHIDANYSFRYGAADITYLDISDSSGQGDETSPIHTWRIEEISDFIESYEKASLPNCICGTGSSSVYAAEAYLDFTTLWREKQVSYQNDDKYTMRLAILRQLDQESDPRSFSFSMPSLYGLQGGDMVKILRVSLKTYPLYSRIQQVSYSMDKVMDVTLGRRVRDLADIWALTKQ